MVYAVIEGFLERETQRWFGRGGDWLAISRKEFSESGLEASGSKEPLEQHSVCVGAGAGIWEFVISDHKIEAEGMADEMGNVGRILNLETIHGIKGLAQQVTFGGSKKETDNGPVCIVSLPRLLFGGEIWGEETRGKKAQDLVQIQADRGPWERW